MVKIKICLLVLIVIVNLSRFECRRGGFSRGSSSKSYGSGSISGKTSSSSSSSSSGSIWSIFGGRKSSSSGSSSTSNSGSASILPLSSGNRNTNNQYAPSAPSLPSGQSGTGYYNRYSPSASPLPTGNSKQPPGPGWNVNHNTGIRRENVPMNNQPPPYPGMANHPPQGPPPPYTGHSSYIHPSPYTGHSSYIHPPPYSGAPPPYPGTGSSFNHGQLPPAYPGISRAPASNMGGSSHYPTQQGGPVYQQYYPPSNHLPPPPPGYSPYGMPYYQKPSSGITGSDVMMGLAFWQLSRSNSHHQHFHQGYYDDSSYHGYNRNHYTTTYHSTNSNPNAPGNQNTLEMTHYVIPDEKGKLTTIVGNQTCVSVYNSKAVNKWATQQMEDFKKKFPNTTFPLFSTGNETFKNNNFTWIPGRIVHIEPISITCCGTHKNPLELSKLTDGKSPHVNCVHLTGQIPFRKMNFIKIEHVNTTTQNMSDWYPLHLKEPDFNSTTPKPINVTSTTPLTIDKTQTFTSLGKNTTSTTPSSIDESQTFSSLGKNSTSTTFPSIDESQTFTPPGIKQISTTLPATITTESVDLLQTFKPLEVDKNQTFSVVINASSTTSAS